MSVVEQAIQHRAHGRDIAQHLAPVFDGTIRSQQCTGSLVAPHDDFQQILSLCAVGQFPPQKPVEAEVHFDQKLQDWDGFGVNYVEVTNVRDIADYKKNPQEYGGFSTLSEEKRQEVLEMIFGADGLKPGLVKMFLDSLHEGMTVASKGQFDHETTTKWMRYFVQEGLNDCRLKPAGWASE
jgi:hypothetical protein